MTENQIYVLMAKTPDIRAVQIADALDQEVEDVVIALGPLMRIGNVAQKNGFSPNGFPALQYNLTDQFKQSPDFAVVEHVVSAQKSAAAPKPVAPAVAPKSKRVDADGEPVIRKQTAAGAEVTIKPASGSPLPPESVEINRAELAIAYATKIGRPVSQKEMRSAMGLHAGQSPSNWLGAAVRNGKLHKAGAMWVAGPKPVDQVDQGRCNVPMASVPEQSPVFRCGFWSDGVLELQRNGSTIARLEQREGEQLVGFFQRMLANASPVQTSARARTE